MLSSAVIIWRKLQFRSCAGNGAGCKAERSICWTRSRHEAAVFSPFVSPHSGVKADFTTEAFFFAIAPSRQEDSEAHPNFFVVSTVGLRLSRVREILQVYWPNVCEHPQQSGTQVKLTKTQPFRTLTNWTPMRPVPTWPALTIIVDLRSRSARRCRHCSWRHQQRGSSHLP